MSDETMGDENIDLKKRPWKAVLLFCRASRG